MGISVAVVGATGVVGETILSILDEKNITVDECYALASSRSVGKRVEFGKQTLIVSDLAEFDFSKVDVAFFSAGGDVSKVFVPKAAKHCYCIDNTSAFRYEADIPLVVPEVNPEDLEMAQTHKIIANPNCSTIQMVVALKPIHDRFTLKSVQVATYQAVSGAGRKAVENLAMETAQLLNGQGDDNKAKPIAFNLIPQIDVFQDNGYTKEEMKMVWESRKILHAPDLTVNPTAVRVPVFFGHSEAIHLETEQPISVEQALAAFDEAPGISVVDGNEYPMPKTHAANHDPVFVGRIRQAIDNPHGLNCWVVSDNVRKGAALNSVQILECLLAQGAL